MKVRILFFATFKDRAGVKETTLEIVEGVTTVSELKQSLAREFPGLAAGLNSALVSVNREFAFDEEAIPAEAEVAIFPPVSGGSNEDC